MFRFGTNILHKPYSGSEIMDKADIAEGEESGEKPNPDA